MGMMIPDPIRRWVKGTEFVTSEDDYSSDGTCIGVGTRERKDYGRSCGITYASHLIIKPKEDEGDIFSIFYS